VTVRIDWPRVLADIAYLLGDPDPSNPDVRTPLGTELLARSLGIPRGTLRNWLDGSEPRHADGEAIIDRWCALTGKSRMFAPMDKPVSSAGRVR